MLFICMAKTPTEEKNVGVASSSVSVQSTLHLPEPLNQARIQARIRFRYYTKRLSRVTRWEH